MHITCINQTYTYIHSFIHAYIHTCLSLYPVECGLTLETVKGIAVKKIVAIQKGVQLWHDRSYTITSFPAYMAGGYYATQPHKAVAQNSLISVTIKGPSTVYVAVESGSRNGGFQNSLLAAGY